VWGAAGIAQLADTKSVDASLTLLHFLARSIDRRWADHTGARLKAELPSLDVARQGTRKRARRGGRPWPPGYACAV
jgi:hypothetical protein